MNNRIITTIVMMFDITSIYFYPKNKHTPRPTQKG